MLVKSPGFVGIKPVVTVVVLLECCSFTGDGVLVFRWCISMDIHVAISCVSVV